MIANNEKAQHINITSFNAITLVFYFIFYFYFLFYFSTYRPSSFKHFCPIRYRGAISHLAVAWTAASIVLCIGHSEACWQMEQMFEWTWTICWDLKHQCYNINVLNFLVFFCGLYAEFWVTIVNWRRKITHRSTVFYCQLCVCLELNFLQNVNFGFFLF